MSIIAGGAQVNQALNMIDLISDPERFKAALTEFGNAKEAAEKAKAEAEQAEVDLENKQATSFAEYTRQQNSTADLLNSLSVREQFIRDAESTLAAHRLELEKKDTDVSAATADLSTRETDLNTRSAVLENRARKLDNQEAEAAKRVAELNAREAELVDRKVALDTMWENIQKKVQSAQSAIAALKSAL